MILDPKVKPVRFRIKSDEVEHGSLASLREHFVWEDVRALLDGRLEKWLIRIGEVDMANRIKECSNRANKYEVFSIIFGADIKSAQDVLNFLGAKNAQCDFVMECLKEITDIEELAPVYVNRPSLREQLRPQILSIIQSIDELDILLNLRSRYPILSRHIAAVFIEKADNLFSLNSLSPARAFEVAKCVGEVRYEDNAESLYQALMLKAAESIEEAKTYCEENHIHSITEKDCIHEIVSDSKYKDTISSIFSGYKPSKPWITLSGFEKFIDNKYKSDANYSVYSTALKSIVIFCKHCINLKIKQSEREYQKMMGHAIEAFGKIDADAPLFTAKRMVLSLIVKNRNESLQYLEPIKDNAFAKRLLEKGEVYIGETTFRMPDDFSKYISNAEHIGIIVKHVSKLM